LPGYRLGQVRSDPPAEARFPDDDGGNAVAQYRGRDASAGGLDFG
jgi:hypothetical protein